MYHILRFPFVFPQVSPKFPTGHVGKGEINSGNINPLPFDRLHPPSKLLVLVQAMVSF
uniref:Uncharacterized protein n=2 Tax=Meloidogyne TaxID=189290 RepID=A0A6V7VJC2_MELEN|nr:unnamed protein product [Meloidogyne enterolobii]